MEFSSVGFVEGGKLGNPDWFQTNLCRVAVGILDASCVSQCINLNIH